MKRSILALLFTATSVIALAQPYTYKGKFYDYMLSYPGFYKGDNGFLFNIYEDKPTELPLTLYFSRSGSIYVCEGSTEYEITFTKDELKELSSDPPIVVFASGKMSNVCLYGNGKILVSRATCSLSVSTEEMKPRVIEIINAARNGLFFTSGGASPSGSMTPERKKAILDNLVANMVRVEGGTFTMGATPEQAGVSEDNEKPIHQVTLSSFSIGRYEVTQEEWEAVMGSNKSYKKGDRCPAERVSWIDCQTFIRKLNATTGKRFRLPTEAEWEYAARGGKLSNGYRYPGSNDPNQVAWYYENSRNVGEDSADYGTHVVGTLAPNELGLYDMAGNVSEWCQDWYGNYRGGMQTNPKGPASGKYHIARGGNWYNDVTQSRVSFRGSLGPSYVDWWLGLRLAQ